MQGRISISWSVLPVSGNRPCCCDSVSRPHVGSGSTRSASTGSGSTGSASTEKCCWHQFAFGIRADNLSHDSEQLNRFLVRNAAEQSIILPLATSRNWPGANGSPPVKSQNASIMPQWCPAAGSLGRTHSLKSAAKASECRIWRKIRCFFSSSETPRPSTGL